MTTQPTGTYDYNTGQLLNGAQQSSFNSQTGQQIGAVPSTVPLSVTTATPIVTPPTNPNPNADVQSALGGLVTSLQTQATADQNTANTDQTAYENLSAQLGQQTADQQKLEAAQGLPQMNTDLRDLNTLQSRQLGQYINTTNKIDQNSTGALRAGQEGQNNYVTRQHGIDALLTNSLISAKSGNIQTAQASVDRALALKYDPIKQALETKKFILQNDNSKAATSRKEALDAQLKQVDRAIQDEKDVKDIYLTAAKYGAPNNVTSAIDKISQSNDPQAYFKAVQLAAPYLTDPVDRSYKIAQTQKLLQDARSANIGDPMETLAYAQQYQSTGKIPTGIPKGTFGSVAQLAKDLPIQPGQIIQRNTGVTPGSDNTLSNAMSALYSATELAKQLRVLDNQRIGGVVSGTLGKVFGSKDQQQYVDLRDQIVDLLARARSGAAINDTELKQYQGMLPGRFSEPFGLGAQSSDRIDNFTNNLTSDLKNKADSQGWAIAGLSTVKIGGQEYKVGDVISNGGNPPIYGRINADGTISSIQ